MVTSPATTSYNVEINKGDEAFMHTILVPAMCLRFIHSVGTRGLDVTRHKEIF